MALEISQGTQIENVKYESNAYACLADMAGYTIDITDPTNILHDPQAGLFFLKVFAAIGTIPLVSDAALRSLPDSVRPTVQRARAIQSTRAHNHENLTPAIALVIAEANDQSGTGTWAEAPAPLGSPMGKPVSVKYWNTAAVAGMKV